MTLEGARRNVMRIHVYLLAILLVLATTSGCTRTVGQEFDVSAAKNIHVGSTNMTTVEQYLGPPLNRESLRGQEIWHYNFVRSTAKPTATAFIPLVGPMMQGAYTGNVDSQTIDIRFNRNIVSSCLLTTSSKQSNDALVQNYSGNIVQRNCDE
jgi:hypothetical protein